jgi:hypothetical protein
MDWATFWAIFFANSSGHPYRMYTYSSELHIYWRLLHQFLGYDIFAYIIYQCNHKLKKGKCWPLTAWASKTCAELAVRSWISGRPTGHRKAWTQRWAKGCRLDLQNRPVYFGLAELTSLVLITGTFQSKLRLVSHKHIRITSYFNRV